VLERYWQYTRYRSLKGFSYELLDLVSSESCGLRLLLGSWSSTRLGLWCRRGIAQGGFVLGGVVLRGVVLEKLLPVIPGGRVVFIDTVGWFVLRQLFVVAVLGQLFVVAVLRQLLIVSDDGLRGQTLFFGWCLSSVRRNLLLDLRMAAV